jgi:hypothetical protein
VAGGILYYLGHRARHVDDAGVALAPSVGPAQITITAVGRF